MGDAMDLTIALNILERKIASLNIQLTKDYNYEIDKELKKLVKYRKEIYEGNKSLIRKIIDDFEND